MAIHPASSATVRKWYFLSLILALLTIVLLRLFALPVRRNAATWQLTLGTILDTLAAATVASIALGIAYIVLFPKDRAELIRVIEARELPAFLRNNAQIAREWSVKARTANYFSHVTLPTLRQAALEEGRGCKIKIQMLDPENDRLMAAYARYRSNHHGDATRWSVERVRREIYAAILQAVLCRIEAPRLEIEVGLSPAFWVVSLDVFNDTILVTGQNKGEPGLALHRESPFFTAWCDDFEASFAECRRLSLDCAGITRDSVSRRDLGAMDRVRQFFEDNLLMKCTRAEDLGELVASLESAHHYE